MSDVGIHAEWPPMIRIHPSLHLHNSISHHFSNCFRMINEYCVKTGSLLTMHRDRPYSIPCENAHE